jgi:hypothetical protein
LIRVFLIALVCAGTAAAQSKPVIRATLQEKGDIIVGQAVHVAVEVLVPNYFAGAPQYPQLDIENAIVTLPEETPQHRSEQIGGESFAGMIRTYVIYPTQPGKFTLPPKEVVVNYAAQPGHPVEARFTLPSVSFEATVPPEAAGLDHFLPTTSLTMSQKFDRPLANLKTGDVVNRTVTIDAALLRAMLIPPTVFEAPDGISVYQKQPRVTDIKTDRGDFVKGRRVDSAGYLIRKPGDFDLPAVSIEWWDTRSRKVRTATLSAFHLHAEPSASVDSELAPEAETPSATPVAERTLASRLWRAAAMAAAPVLLVALWWFWLRLRPVLVARWSRFREQHRDREAESFGALRRAAKSGNRELTFACLLQWLNRFQPGDTLDEFLRRNGDHELVREVEALAARLYGGLGTTARAAWSGNRMMAGIERARRHKGSTSEREYALPALNPSTNSHSRPTI